MDYDTTHVGRVTDAIQVVFLDHHVMIMSGFTENTKNYGNIVGLDEYSDTFGWMGSNEIYPPGEGLLILEIQAGILKFLYQCCTQILHDISESDLMSDSLPLSPEPPLYPESETSGFESLSVMASEAPYRVPAQLNLILVESLLSARASAAEDHLWDLREDPDYFSRTLLEAKDHYQEALKDSNSSLHPSLSRDLSESLWAQVISYALSKAYIELELFTELSRQARNLVLLQRQYASDVDPSKDLPDEYKEALLRFRYYLGRGAEAPLSSLKSAIVASPPLRRYFSRQPSPDSNLTDTYRASRKLLMKDKSAQQLLQLLYVLCEDSNALRVIGMSHVTDSIERLLQSDKKAQQLLSSYLTTVFGDISIISQCLKQLNSYYPWARGFDVETLEHENEFEKDYAERTKSWDLIIATIHNQSVSGQAASLGEPSGDKFFYPVEKRRTKKIADALRRAEHNLDDFWAYLDNKMSNKADYLSDTASRSLLSQSRNLLRTPEWIEEEDSSTGRGGLAQHESTGSIPGPEALYHHSSVVNSFEPAPRKQKIKTRGQPNPYVPIPEMETSIQANDPDSQPTFFLDPRALKVFQTLFFSPGMKSPPGEVSWCDFVYAMTSVGFTAIKLYGSVWQFQQSKLEVHQKINFHEPHPESKLTYRNARLCGRRLKRAFGWHGEMFALTQKCVRSE
ncbi:uncharacterized protein N7500_002140 [Penicillium coprophilum]|uniref:uncharacterized protein n=1 Tax=Penicillium coprophilum TaxID=36646 RepID=UPI002395E5EF|nr:uncharacterized protein N7500_002140 [Penicillium coprophilum]KAJ5169357.1 hypothetical protein N7500_002140 [Penicillium coprophilum]